MMNGMRVLVHSWGHGLNHGQLLQAQGLRYMIKKLSGLDDRQILGMYTNPAERGKELSDALSSLTMAKYILFKREWAGLGGTVSKEQGDIHVYGSDHIWGGTSFYGLNDQMFGSTKEVKISYAPSSGDYVYSSEEIERLGPQIKSFRSLSVRDRSTQLQIRRLHGCTLDKIPIVCDPAFFLGDNIRGGLARYSKDAFNNITVYANIKILSDSAEKYLERRGLRVVYAGYSPRKKLLKRANISKSGLDLASSILYPFMHSRLVVTNTFHGCVMALMARRPFVALVNKNLRARLNSPLFDNIHSRRFMNGDEFGRLMTHPEEISSLFDASDIEWDCIDKEIDYSSEWLKNAIEEARRMAS